jgi:hypothetical protein
VCLSSIKYTGMSFSNNKSTYYAILQKTLNKYQLTMDEYKKNPMVLFVKDKPYRNYVYKKFDPVKTYKWFGREFKWHDYSSELNNFDTENDTWYSKLNSSVTADNDFHTSNDDSVPTTKGEDTQEEPPPLAVKKQKTHHDEPMQVEEPPTAESNTGKRPAETQDTLEGEPKSKVTNVAKSLGEQARKFSAVAQAQETIQKIPGGTSEVNQQPQTDLFQLQNNRGTDQNQRGTLQGEAGNLKVQKPLERYGIVKVYNMNSYKNYKITKLLIFVLECKVKSNALVELMDETYDSGTIYSTKYTNENNNKEYYIIGWKLNFNIGFITLAEKLGTRYNATIVYTKNINFDNYNTDEEIETLMRNSYRVRSDNDTQLYTLAENCQFEHKKKTEASQYNQNNSNNRKRKLPVFD